MVSRGFCSVVALKDILLVEFCAVRPKKKKPGLFEEVRRFQRVTDGGRGKVVKSKGFGAQSSAVRS
jgi:hypothetical protein